MAHGHYSVYVKDMEGTDVSATRYLIFIQSRIENGGIE
jgi:hypothetical protein